MPRCCCQRPLALFALRCTQKLIARLKAAPEPHPPRPDTVLGDWTATLVRAGRATVVLAVSERTLLPVVLPAAPAATLLCRVADSVGPMAER